MTGKVGGQKGNLNTARSGKHLTRLTLGELPLTMRRQTQNARKYRRGLEALVVEAKGSVNTTDAHLIDEAAAAEVHASVCRWLLRTRLDTMSVSDVARCSEQILKAKRRCQLVAAGGCGVFEFHGPMTAAPSLD
jgi:hypothetical protein